MWPFKHKHKIAKSKAVMKGSLLTGVPVQTGHISWCKCGKEIERYISSAGYQQLSWGAEEESLFDEGPIRPRKDMKEQVRAMQILWLRQSRFTNV